MLETYLKPPTPKEVKKLTVIDIAIMSGLADSLRDRLEKYIEIDPYTMPDPFDNKSDHSYSIIANREEPNRIVAMMAIKKNLLPQLPWNRILDERLGRVELSKIDAAALKYEMMPKDTNNFYPYRCSGKIAGYIMFAFQICGQH
jgi:hypothetical protein